MSDETEKFPNTKKKTRAKNAREENENAVVDTYAVREGRDGSVDSMTAAFHAMHEKSTKDTHDDALTDVAQVMRERYASLRASIAEKCAPATFDGARGAQERCGAIGGVAGSAGQRGRGAGQAAWRA